MSMANMERDELAAMVRLKSQPSGGYGEDEQLVPWIGVLLIEVQSSRGG